MKLQQFIVKKAVSLFDASLLEVDNESQDRPPGEEGEFMIIVQHTFYRKMYECNYCCCHFFFYQNVGVHVLFDKFPCCLQVANTKISLKQKVINTHHTYVYCDLFCCCIFLKKFQCQLPGEGEVIVQNHVEAT